jgi:hypothetical protein
MKLFVFFIIGFVNTVAIAFFINFPFGPKFNIKDKEITKKINYGSLTPGQKNIINNINGFYGLIGPDINMDSVTNIFDLFTADGLIQGVFFDDGEITFTKHFIRTDKLNYEEQNGRIPNNRFLKLIFEIFSTVNLLPSLLGVSNTALLNIDDNTYALYERDVPYKLKIDFENKQIKTIKRFPIENIMHFSAHSKSKNNSVETIDYDIFTNTVSYYELNNNLKIIKHKRIPTRYLPIIHDFWSSQNKIIFFDSPLTIDLKKIFITPMPVKLDETKKTIINILDKDTMKIDQYYLNESLYMFHYANYKETDTNMEIYTTFYDKIDFNELNITGKYRKIVIDKDTKEVQIEKYEELEELNLEFPILYDDKTLFRSIKNNTPNGFVICKDMEVIKKIEFVNKFICGEPTIKKIDDSYHLITYYFNIYNNKDSKILILNLDTYDYIDIPIREEMKMGFHSIFIPNQ